MIVYVPYTQVTEATRIALLDYPDATWIDVSSSDGAYQDYLEQRWADDAGFINLEHDVVPWPGAIDAIADCQQGWCVYGYSPDWDCLHSSAPLGLVKFARSFISTLPDIWKDYGRQMGRAWGGCDAYLFHYATERGIIPHQHFPSVTNANPNLLDEGDT